MSSPRPPEALPVFLLDENTSGHFLAERLSVLGLSVLRFEERFSRGVRDEKWLPVAGRNGWIVISRDDHIRYRALELDAVKRAGVRMFTFVQGRMLTKEGMAEVFAAALPSIKRKIHSYAPPFVFRISREGKVLEVADFPYRKIPKKHRSRKNA